MSARESSTTYSRHTRCLAIHRREHGKYIIVLCQSIVTACTIIHVINMVSLQWYRYDKHREEILRGAGSDYKDDSVNLMPYFSASVFSGYGDDPKV
jgi:hypothetical protein